jgi:hypothetical protein
MIIYLGVIKNGSSLLSTVKFAPKHGERDDPLARREAGRALDGWRAVFPFDRLSIEPLSRRDARGWEIENGAK